MPILEMNNVRYAYGKHTVPRGISAQLEQGKMYAILGPSGCGKTTLLSLLGGLDSPTSSQILYQGEDIEKTGLADHRRSHEELQDTGTNLDSVAGRKTSKVSSTLSCTLLTNWRRGRIRQSLSLMIWGTPSRR